MVLPISGFLPVPLPMMIPFMGAQSMVIGKAFGEGFQYGKRKISAMPNEEFNKLTFESMMSNFRTELKNSIPTMNASLKDMQPMVEVVVREFFNYISLVTKTVTGTGTGPNIFSEEGGEIGEAIAHALGTHAAGVSHPTTTEPQITTFVPETNVTQPITEPIVIPATKTTAKSYSFAYKWSDTRTTNFTGTEAEARARLVELTRVMEKEKVAGNTSEVTRILQLIYQFRLGWFNAVGYWI